MKIKKTLFFTLLIINLFQTIFIVLKDNFINKDIFDAKSFGLYLSFNSEAEGELKENIENQLNDINFDKLNNLVDNLSNQGKDLIEKNDFLSLVKNFIYGDNGNLLQNIFPVFINSFFEDILFFLPYFSLIIAISLIYSMISHFSSDKNKSVSNLINIVCFVAIASVVLKLLLDLIDGVSSVITNIESQTEVIFPVLLTLINALGGVVTATSFQPLLAVLSVGITKLFTLILLPIFISSIIFGIVGNISKNIKLEKFSKFFTSLFGWIIGIVFTIFIAFLTIQGLTVSSIDSISLKTAKYAIKSYIPILGSYLSDGVGLILASSILIKNAIGATGLILIFATILFPIIKIIILILLFKLVSAILESISDEKVSNFLFNISKSLNMLSVCLLAVGFMFLISISLLMGCSNIV
ncbi:MAG: stage III sporulation protein AE [Clostridia bacterium]|nr:stage III sporulation protein AE [Clostridia bacterium]